MFLSFAFLLNALTEYYLMVPINVSSSHSQWKVPFEFLLLSDSLIVNFHFES